MPSTVATKHPADTRIVTRLPKANRAFIERAAAVYGATINQFVVQSAMDRAGEILRQTEQLRLSARDTKIFLDALERPPAPAKALVKALKAHDSLVKC